MLRSGCPTAPGAAVGGNPAADKALAATVAGLKKNSAAPQDPKALQEAAANLTGILNPGLAEREARRDPAFVQAEAAATSSFSNPGALHARKMEDPTYRTKYQAAMDAFKRQGKEAAMPIRPSVTTAQQIESLRNDPVFRRERAESMQAQMPPFPVPTNGLGILHR